MILKLVMWLISMMSVAQKKAIIISTLENIVEGTEGSIDKQTAEIIIGRVVKSTGNNITAFIVKE